MVPITISYPDQVVHPDPWADEYLKRLAKAEEEEWMDKIDQKAAKRKEVDDGLYPPNAYVFVEYRGPNRSMQPPQPIIWALTDSNDGKDYRVEFGPPDWQAVVEYRMIKGREPKEDWFIYSQTSRARYDKFEPQPQAVITESANDEDFSPLVSIEQEYETLGRQLVLKSGAYRKNADPSKIRRFEQLSEMIDVRRQNDTDESFEFPDDDL